MSRLFKERADLREAWGNMPGENKGDFLHENKDRFGEELRVMLERQVVRRARQVKLTDFESTGEFKDEDDINAAVVATSDNARRRPSDGSR